MTKRVIVPFTKKALAGTTGYMTFRVPSNGTVEELRVRFYPGVEEALQVTPFIERKGGSAPDYLIEQVEESDTFLSGDDDYLVFPITYAVNQNDFLKIYYNNTSSQYDYSLKVYIVVDYIGGTNTVR